jgi:feruloyl esterase
LNIMKSAMKAGLNRQRKYALLRSPLLAGFIATTSLSGLWAQTAESCQKLAGLALPDTTVTLAAAIDAGAFPAPAGGGQAAAAREAYKKLPGFCRVAATIRPTSDSEIKMEVWLPISDWNGKLQVVGNGGWSGSISYPAMARALASGYATASTNTGHDGERASFVPGHPEKFVDFAWRAVHLTTIQSKAVVAAYYGNPARYSYWNGCSTGGRQGLKEAQRFPDDFDGLIIGDPVNNWVHQKAADVAMYQLTHRTPESFIPLSKYPMIHKAVMDQCDAMDGVVDGVLENPRLCHWDPVSILCKGEDGPNCLTAPQVTALTKLYAPTRIPKTGEILFPGMERGTELAMGGLIGNEPHLTATDLFTYVVFNNPNWDQMTLNLDTDVALADKIDAVVSVSATNPDLKPLFAHNGKMIMYHGFSDQLVMPGNSINYYNSVVEKSGGLDKTTNSIRLFMVPGMGHCAGGEGPNQFDMVTALDQWVEKGKAPERIIASRITDGKVTRTRPLCPYPQVAKYKGTGSTDDEANFVCQAQ